MSENTSDSSALYDVVIVGGGMVGSMLAAALGHTRLRVAVLEAKAPAPFLPGDPYDLRVSALSIASERMLTAVNAWAGIAARRSCPYRRMRVWDGEEYGKTEFFAGDVGETHLGHIVENRVLQLALIDRIVTLPDVDWLCPASLDKLRVFDGHVEISLSDQRKIAAKLVVGADGAASVVRDSANIPVDRVDYPQQALVATVATALPQQSITWQRFLPTGPQAFLPLKGSFASMVWYHSAEEVGRLKSLTDEQFIVEMERAFPPELGAVTGLLGRGSFPLNRSHAKNYVKSRIALIGDAAHTVHPLAGQGVNLGLMDAAVLAEVIIKASNQQRDIGKVHNLRPYQRWRRAENALMINVLDGFYHAFKPRSVPLRQLRSLALNVADKATPLKQLVTRHAMGLDGDLPLLAKGLLPAVVPDLIRT